jgi:MFS family permease
MTTTALTLDAPSLVTPRQVSLITRPLLLRFVSIFGASASFYLPLSVVPMYAKSSGSDAGAGLSTGVLLLATVAVELVTPRLVARTGYRLALAAGLFFLGVPALALLASSSLPVILTVNVVRGAGFAVVTVAGGALTASMVPQERRGEGLALTGVVSGVPALLSLPLGVWAAARWGVGPVFVATAARLAAGRIGDRHGHARLLGPGVLLSAAGMAAIAATGSPSLVIGGAAVFGAGFGLLQNSTLAMMYTRTDRTGYNASARSGTQRTTRAWARAPSAWA